MAVATAPRGKYKKAKKAVSVAGKILADFPLIAAQLHPELNGGLVVGQVRAGSEQKLWWACFASPDHVWEASVKSRTSLGNGCPCCSHRQVSATNSLATKYPDIAAQLHPELNGGLTPDQIVAGSDQKLWWLCDRDADHAWKAAVNSRTGNGRSCPYCVNQIVSRTNSLATKYPEIAAQLHPELNGGLAPDQIVAGSGKKYWWICNNGSDHVWEATVSDRTSGGHGCPHCCVTGRSRFELQVAALLRSHTGLRVEVDSKAQVPGHTRRLQVDLEVPELGFLIDLDPAYWHQDGERDQRKIHLLAAGDDRTYIRVRAPGTPHIRGNVVDAVYCPEAFANALRPFLEALTTWRELDPTEVAAALAAAAGEWSELLVARSEQFATAA